MGVHVSVIILTVVLYILLAVFGGLSAAHDSSLFPSNVFKVLSKYSVDITPASGAYAVGWVILVVTLLWLIYLITTIFREGEATEILTFRFYVYFNLSMICYIIDTFIWSREQILATFLVGVVGVVFLILAMYQAFKEFHDFATTHDETAANKFDFCCHRYLLQDGLLFFVSWAVYETLLALAIVFTHTFKVVNQTSSIISLILLAVFAVGWFVLENFAVSQYTQCSVSAYVALIWATSGIHAHIWGLSEAVGVLNLVILIFSCLFLVARIVILAVRCHKKKSYENIGYNAENEAITS